MYLNNNENASSWLSYDYEGNDEVENSKILEEESKEIDGNENDDETAKYTEEESDKLGALNIPNDYRRRKYSNENLMGWSYSPTYDFSNMTLTNKLQRQDDILVEVRRQCKKSLSDKNLRLIGLNREYMEGWALVMMKIMFYPELLKTEEEYERFVYI